ncbi:hypothetical protein QYE76_003097 [Lolium multiflorum]|uniref:CCHC-type domain-containing protein n=1 Tax=Lolium multiflorum TaxID=4521 RepID=A0AAD8RQX0_LOLMU|nr:hypothetical protein QYE76_003097 [Lolium multiflorum]
MKLTAAESSKLFIDDRADVQEQPIWALAGKVLKPKVLHIQTIADALRPAWGNPRGLVFRDGGPNMFVAELPSERERDRIWERSPWTVNKHAVVLENFKRSQRPSELRFERLPIWVRVMNLPFNLNDDWGKMIASRIGEYISVDTSNTKLVSGKYLRARVSINVHEPLQRWMAIDSTLREACDWYEIKYENLPYFCFSCGILGHSDLVCPEPAERDEMGRLPYGPSLRALDERKKRAAPFAWGNAQGRGNAHTEPNASGTRNQTQQGGNVPEKEAAPAHLGGGRGGGRDGNRGDGRFADARGNLKVYRRLPMDGTEGSTAPMETENRMVVFDPQITGGKREERPEKGAHSAAPSPDAKKKKVADVNLDDPTNKAPAAEQLGQSQ